MKIGTYTLSRSQNMSMTLDGMKCWTGILIADENHPMIANIPVGAIICLTVIGVLSSIGVFGLAWLAFGV